PYPTLFRSVDVFRLNFSHGTHEDHKMVIDYVRELNQEMGTSISLLQDLQGPKIRVQEVEPGTVLERNQSLIITTRQLVGNREIVSTSYTDLTRDVRVGDLVLVDDGKIELKVTEVREEEIVTEVVHGGPLKSRKGINLPFTKVSAPSRTPKDIEDLEFGIKNDVDWIARSFVRKASDIQAMRDILNRNNSKTSIIAKSEKPEALSNIDEIIALTDGVMVARGDLGVEIWLEEVPMVQKMIIEKCNAAGKPVIV